MQSCLPEFLIGLGPGLVDLAGSETPLCTAVPRLLGREALPEGICSLVKQKLTSIIGKQSLLPNTSDIKEGVCIEITSDVHRAYSWACEAYHTISEFFELFDYSIPFDKEQSGFLLLWTFIEFIGLGVSWMKFNTAYLFGKVSRQSELPPMPDGYFLVPGILLGGKCYHLCRTWMQYGVCPEIAATILQLKKGMPAVSDEFVQKALLDHFSALSQDREISEEEDDVLEELGAQCIRTTRECLRSACRPTCGMKVPSSSAHYECSRRDGGALALLLKDFRNLSKDQILFMYESSPGLVRETYVLYVDSLEFTHLLRSFAMDDEDRAEPVALSEALKARIITKGPTRLYYYAKHMQKKVHSALRDHRCLQLIGAPVNSSIVSSVMGVLGEEEEWVSADYKASTDNINPFLSDLVGQEICRCMGWDALTTQVMCRALTGHRLDYSQKRSPPDWSRTIRQQWGQLMGSPVSFPVLCLINLAVIRYAMELDVGRSISLREARILVNGDDAVFPARPELYELWCWLTKIAGLERSLGKNYRSREFLIINSQYFSYDINDLSLLFGPTFSEVPIINFGLLQGKCRSRCLDERDLVPVSSNIADRFNDLTRPWQWRNVSLCSKLESKFIQYNRELLDSVPRGMSWFVHPSLGGLGLRVMQPSVSERQLKLASYYSCSKECKLVDLLGGATRVVPNPEVLEHALSLYRTTCRQLGVTEIGLVKTRDHSVSKSPLQMWMGAAFLDLASGAQEGDSCEAITNRSGPSHRDVIRIRGMVEREYSYAWKKAVSSSLHPMKIMNVVSSRARERFFSAVSPKLPRLSL